jgi:hypothetical protein
LKYYGKLGILASLKDEYGNQVFPEAGTAECQLEYTVKYLGEKSVGRTSVDVLFNGDHRIAVECKLAEREIGKCSKECEGPYTCQSAEDTKCPLSLLGISHWDHVPSLFDWECPLRDTYQLVRNILAACVNRETKILDASGHAVLLYDERNPEFKRGGKAMNAWQKTNDALKDKSLLRRCTWQELAKELRKDKELEWLTDALKEKYGF